MADIEEKEAPSPAASHLHMEHEVHGREYFIDQPGYQSRCCHICASLLPIFTCSGTAEDVLSFPENSHDIIELLHFLHTKSQALESYWKKT